MLADLEAIVAASPRVSRLPRDKRGLPIPHVVLRDPETGEPDFIVNDTRTLLDCAQNGICHICGETLPDNDVWMLGGPGSALDPRGLYNDGPMHHECGRASLRLCPYLALPAHRGMKPLAKEGVLARAVREGRALAFIDPTVDPTKPETFIFGRVAGLLVRISVRPPGVPIVRFLPNRPFVEIEEWSGGVLLAATRPADPGYSAKQKVLRARGLASMKAAGVSYTQLAPAQHAAWTNRLTGFPWHHTTSG